MQAANAEGRERVGVWHRTGLGDASFFFWDDRIDTGPGRPAVGMLRETEEKNQARLILPQWFCEEGFERCGRRLELRSSGLTLYLATTALS